MSKAREWPRGWQMPGPRAAQNLQMPHPRDWQGGQMPRISPGGRWAQLELTDPLLCCSDHYCAFHKQANSVVQKPPTQLGFLLPPIIITTRRNEPWNTETSKTDGNPPITIQKPWPFEPVKVKSCFLRGPLRWLTAPENAVVSWLLNFRIHMFVKSAVSTRAYYFPSK